MIKILSIPALITTVLVLDTAIPIKHSFVKIGSDEKSIHYVDTANVSRKGSSVFVWTLQDLNYKGETGMSYYGFDEINCARSTLRPIRLVVYSGNMATGSIVEVNEVEKEHFDITVSIEQGRIPYKIKEFVCK